MVDGGNNPKTIETVELSETDKDPEDKDKKWYHLWTMLPRGYVTENEEHIYKYDVEEARVLVPTENDPIIYIEDTMFTKTKDQPLPIEGGTFKLTNSRTSSFELPSTGGPGTTGLYVLGSILTLMAAVLLITKKRSDAAGID